MRVNERYRNSCKCAKRNRWMIYPLSRSQKTFASLIVHSSLPPPLATLSTYYICRTLITDRTDNYRWICLPARLKASCEVSRQPLRGFTWKRREKSAGFRRAMPEAGLPAALRGNFVAVRDRRRQSGGPRSLQLLQMTHRQLENIRLLQLANVLAFGLRTIALSDLSFRYMLPSCIKKVV